MTFSCRCGRFATHTERVGARFINTCDRCHLVVDPRVAKAMPDALDAAQLVGLRVTVAPATPWEEWKKQR